MNYAKGFIAPLLLALITLLLIGGGAYVFVQNNQANQSATTEATSTAQTSSSQTATQPHIDSVVPASVSIGSTVTIMGSNFDWVRPTPCEGNGCAMRSEQPVSVTLTNSSNQSQILWLGNRDSMSTITVAIPSGQPCVFANGIGGCARGAYVIIPGQYSLSVSVDGMGKSNSMPLTIMAQTLTTNEMPAEITCFDTPFCPMVGIWATGADMLSIRVPPQYAKSVSLEYKETGFQPENLFSYVGIVTTKQGTTWKRYGYGDAGCSSVRYYLTSQNPSTTRVTVAICEGDKVAMPSDDLLLQILDTLAGG